MTTIASQITSLAVVYSTVYSDADQSKHQSSASLAFVWGIHRDRWIPRTKGQLRGKCFHLMTSSWFGDIMSLEHQQAQYWMSILLSWWHYQTKAFSASLALCEGNPPVTDGFKGQWRGALMFSLICAWTNGCANNRDTSWFEMPLRSLWRHFDG